MTAGDPSRLEDLVAVDEDLVWGDAEITYPDWKGTARLNERMTGRSVYELVGPPQDEWIIVGLDLAAASTGTNCT